MFSAWTKLLHHQTDSQVKLLPLEGPWRRVVALEKKTATRQSAVCTTSRPHKCMRSGPDRIVKPFHLMFYIQGELGLKLGLCSSGLEQVI
jgi:hypothetical protein